jgi:hypothetical protein
VLLLDEKWYIFYFLLIIKLAVTGYIDKQCWILEMNWTDIILYDKIFSCYFIYYATEIPVRHYYHDWSVTMRYKNISQYLPCIYLLNINNMPNTCHNTLYTNHFTIVIMKLLAEQLKVKKIHFGLWFQKF